MDQIVTSGRTPAATRKAARISRGYSLEDLAIATGLTVAESPPPRNLANRYQSIMSSASSTFLLSLRVGRKGHGER